MAARTSATAQAAAGLQAAAATSSPLEPRVEAVTIEAAGDDVEMLEPPPAVDNVVQLNAPARRTRTARQARTPAEPATPKKSALPKHRKQGLVKPA
jgi:hypothetical protein